MDSEKAVLAVEMEVVEKAWVVVVMAKVEMEAVVKAMVEVRVEERVPKYSTPILPGVLAILCKWRLRK